MKAARSQWASLVVASATFASGAHAEPVRFLVAVGSSQGLSAERPLKFAAADAANVTDAFVRFGGVDRRDAELLVGPTPADVYAALERVRARAAKLRPADVTVVFYFSGHGDREAMHLGDDRVPFSDLERALGEVPAALRIAVTDACRTFRDKGFSAEAPFALAVDVSPQATGSVWLHASSDGETAQESDGLGGAIFTHAWVNGLRGAADSNADLRVTLDESFAFARAQTMIRSSKSSGVLQKPEAILNLRELAPIVLTETAAKSAALVLPPGRDAHYLVYAAGNRGILAELWAADDRPTALRLGAGRYVVLRRSGGRRDAAYVGIADGEQRNLGAADFSTSPLAAVAAKGADASSAGDSATAASSRAPNEVGAAFEAAHGERLGAGQGARVDLARMLSRRFALTAGAGVIASARDDADSHERILAPSVRAGIEARVALGPRFTARAFAGLHTAVLFQRLARGATFAGGGLEIVENERAFAFGPEAGVGVRASWPTGGATTVFVDFAGGVRTFFVDQAGEARLFAAATFAAGGGLRF